MTKPSQEQKLTRGEAVIRRAFRRSVLSLAVAGVAIAAIALFMQRHEAPVPVQEQPLTGPAQTAPEPQSGPPSTRFSDITAAAGIDFVHVNGAYGERLMPETMGSGAAFFDVDNDGDQDLFLVNSRYWPGHEGPGTPSQALYQNDGGGRFRDVTSDAGLNLTTFGMGVAVGDYDGDGWVDLYLTALGGNRLFRNQGGGRFRDVTAEAGVAGRDDLWSASAAFLDYDHDGDLDLFVANYVKWSREIDLEIDFRLTGLGRAYGAPTNFVGTHNSLYRNEGQGRFRDISAEAGIEVTDPVSGLPVGKGLGIAAVDYDRDGWIDLIVANDTVRNFLFHNRRDGTFEEVGAFEGIAYDRNGKATSGMGIDAAYYRNDAELGVVIGNFANEMTSLFVTAGGRPPFADEAVLEGIGPASRLALTFGELFFDYDLDGRLDLVQANGHLEHEINRVQPSQQYAQPAQLFWNCGGTCRGHFLLVQDPGDLNQPLVGRGSAYADIDGDGDLDLLITQNGRRPALLRNDHSSERHWLRVKLVGRLPNPDAIGARLELTAGGNTQERLVMPTRSYLSQVELPATFGLGKSAQVEKLRVTWPDGSIEERVPTAVDRTLEIRQGGNP